jgi:integrase
MHQERSERHVRADRASPLDEEHQRGQAPPGPAGIPELTFHDLRHPGASLMIAAGYHVKVIAEQMGRTDGGGLVLKRYGHLYRGARLAAATVLEAHVSRLQSRSLCGTDVG